MRVVSDGFEELSGIIIVPNQKTGKLQDFDQALYMCVFNKCLQGCVFKPQFGALKSDLKQLYINMQIYILL